MAQAAERGLTNLEIVTCDMNEFDPRDAASSRMPLHGFDRIVSIEMFEHMRNWEKLLGRVRSWLHDEGRFFAHVFAHRTHPYRFEDDKAEANNENPRVKSHGNWMGEHFFSGGIMPSQDLFHQFSDVLTVEEDWWWDGRHYGRTSEHWLENLDRNQALQGTPNALEALQGTPNASGPKGLFMLRRWRVFWSWFRSPWPTCTLVLCSRWASSGYSSVIMGKIGWCVLFVVGGHPGVAIWLGVQLLTGRVQMRPESAGSLGK